mmetsp:Transcript_115159/g.246116  ORF Transcript_115159/g.246116 Transcript_115159/m.246116 type:complete len:126 (-) Transcript_115159:146-523(-)
MARRSPLAPVVALFVAACLVCNQLPSAFLPPAAKAPAPMGQITETARVASAAALMSIAAEPLPAFALAGDDDDEGFDFRILAVLGLPLTAASWALFNVWRVAFRQGARIGEGISGSSKAGLKAED